MSALAEGDDGVLRCWWGASTPEYQAYHDTEWGFPVADDRRLFEKLVLEGFQSGLSWLTILRKRENFRKAFAGFDFEQRRAVRREATSSGYSQDAGIVSHRGKIEAAINNAQRAVELVEAEGSFAAYVWGFEPDHEKRTPLLDQTPESQALAKDLKRRGWRFVGPTTVYAFMQAMGLVNDHLEGCVALEPVQRARAAFTSPSSGTPSRRTASSR